MIAEQLQPNPQKFYDYSQNVNLNNLQSDLNYILVLNISASDAHKLQNHEAKPFVYTYKDPFTRLRNVIQELTDLHPQLSEKQVYLTYRDNGILGDNYTMEDIKKELARDNINGLTLFTRITDKMQAQQYESDSSDQYIDQCCITDYKAAAEEFGSQKPYELLVKVMHGGAEPEVLPFLIDPSCKAEVLLKQILRAFKIDYGVDLEAADIKGMTIEHCKKPIIWMDKIMSQPIYNKSILNIQLKDPNIKFKRIASANHNSYLIIYKEGETDPQKFKYEDIAQLTFLQLHQSEKLQLPKTQAKKDIIYALKIMDMIIKPDEPISKAEVYFRNPTNTPISVVAKIITEKMVFYHTIPPLSHNKEFSLDELNIPKQQLKKRDQCRNLSKIRAESSKIEYFKVKENLQPILVYTSQLKYEQKDQKNYIIYEALNRYLRQNPLLTLDNGLIDQEWKYRYASTLMKHLEKIPRYEGQVYRGVSYDPRLNENDIITFKQFLSTSLHKHTAKSFAKQNSQGKFKHVFKMSIKGGFPIKDYSAFIGEDEVLLEPFTEFKVQKIIQEEENGSIYKTYELIQVESSKKLPQVKANFVIWIDDCPKEGKQIYEKIQLPIETTVLVQLLSTEQLKVWLQKNAKLFKDPTANLMFISDMTRKEGMVWNPIAGIEGYRQILKYDENTPIFFYIGDRAAAVKKCKDNGVDQSKITIGNQVKQIHSFISKHIEYYKQ